MGERNRTDGSTVVERVVRLIADREGVDPVDLDVPLADSIDPDALAGLVESAGDDPTAAPLRVDFSYYGYDVVVVADGTVYARDDP